ncbi:MAG TPA: acyl-CoA carboxylase subunit beta [Caulobacteraceae bacterium]|nr:acyl-CoA carboxylase subunit beta [Caulobacteraceae bacterium]
MPPLETSLVRESEAAKANRAAHLALIEQFRTLEAKVIETSNRSADKFHKRGQLLPRERVKLLLDRDAPFLELSTLAGLGMHEDDGDQNVFGGGMIAGIGFVEGVRCMVFASDSGIKGGAAHPMGTQKALRCQTIALENRLPLINLVESAGANLMLQSEQFVVGGGTFANMAKLSAAGVPVVSVVHGSSTAGGAYQTGLADYIVLVKGRSKVFLAGPPLLRAATGEVADDETLGGADMHTLITGMGEYLAVDDRDAIRIAREVFAKLPWIRHPVARSAAKPPRFSPDEILDLVPVDYRKPYDAHELIARIVDDSDFLDFKPAWGAYTVCGHAAIEGQAVGILANNGPIDAAGASKAAQFIQLCCQSGTPLVFLQNTTGFIVGVEAERQAIIAHGSRMIQAVTNATVPKVTVQIGASFGAGHYAMCGRAFGPRFVLAWPNYRISVMGGEQAAKVLTIVGEDGARARGQEPDHARLSAMSERIVTTYDRESTALYATAHVWDDGLIDPRDTRHALAFCLATAMEGDARQVRPNSFGVARI